MSRAQLQSAYPKLTELFSNSRSDDNGKLKPTLERLVSSFSFPFSSSEEAKECATSGGGRFLLTADGALLASSVCFGACALVLSVSILTSRPLLVRKSVVNSEKRVVSVDYQKAVRGDFAFGLGLMWVSAVLFITGMAFSILFLVREYRAVRDNRRSRGENEFGHFRDSDDDVDVNQSFISENFRRKW